MKFKKWVEAQGGSTMLGAKLRVHASTVNHWLYGTSTPKAVVMQKLVKMGKGAFSYDDVINETKKKGKAS